MTTLLEQRYRRVLRLLPSYYRAEWEEEMVETYLHDADTDTGDDTGDGDGEDAGEGDLARPELAEVASVVALAVRTRLAGDCGAPPRYAALGSAVRTFALLSVLLHAAGAITQQALTATSLTGAAQRQQELVLGALTGHGLLRGVVDTTLWVLPLVWAGAYAALVRGRSRTALALSALAALPELAHLISPSLYESPGAWSADAVVTAGFAWLTVAAVGCAYHSGAPPARLPCTASGGAGVALVASCVLLGGATVAWPRGADAVWGSGCVVIVAGAVWCALRAGSPHRAHSPGLPLALAALSLAVLAQRATTLALLAGAGSHARTPEPPTGGAEVQLALLAVLVVVLAATGVRDLPARVRARGVGTAAAADAGRRNAA